MSIRVMLADDHVLMREGIRQLLEFDGSIEVVAEANDGEECLEKIEVSKPQVLLLDINITTNLHYISYLYVNFFYSFIFNACFYI